jgi:hypothetical protein
VKCLWKNMAENIALNGILRLIGSTLTVNFFVLLIMLCSPNVFGRPKRLGVSRDPWGVNIKILNTQYKYYPAIS